MYIKPIKNSPNINWRKRTKVQNPFLISIFNFQLSSYMDILLLNIQLIWTLSLYRHAPYMDMHHIWNYPLKNILPIWTYLLYGYIHYIDIKPSQTYPLYGHIPIWTYILYGHNPYMGISLYDIPLIWIYLLYVHTPNMNILLIGEMSLIRIYSLNGLTTYMNIPNIWTYKLYGYTLYMD